MAAQPPPRHSSIGEIMDELMPKCWFPTLIAQRQFFAAMSQACRVEGCEEPARKWYDLPEAGYYCLVHDPILSQSALFRKALKPRT